MITSALIDRVSKIIWVRYSAFKKKQIIQVFPISDDYRVPERVLEEIIPGTRCFKDNATKQRYKLCNKSLKPI